MRLDAADRDALRLLGLVAGLGAAGVLGGGLVLGLAVRGFCWAAGVCG